MGQEDNTLNEEKMDVILINSVFPVVPCLFVYRLSYMATHVRSMV